MNRQMIGSGCPCGVIFKSLDCGTALLRSLSDKYPWERYEPSYPPSYELNSTTIIRFEG